MKKFLNDIRRNSIIALVGFVALGVLLLIFPNIVSLVSGYIVGALAVGFGATKIIGYFSKNKERQVGVFSLVVGIIFAVLGIYVISNPDIVTNFLVSIFGTVILIYGITKLKNAIDMKKSGMTRWAGVLANAVIALLIGLLFVVNPKISHTIMMRILGGGLVVIGIADLWTFFDVTRDYKNIIKEAKDEIEVEGTVISEEDND